MEIIHPEEKETNNNNINSTNNLDEIDETITKELWHILRIKELLRILETYDNYQNPEYTNYNDNEKLFIRKLYKTFPNIVDWDKNLIQKIRRYLSSLPKDLMLDDIIESIKYNIEYDFQKLLDKFQLKDLKIKISENSLHLWTCNQIRITYTLDNKPETEFFLACLDCFFICENGTRKLFIQNIQWELKNPLHKSDWTRIWSQKELERFKQKMYGKLSKELWCNDRWHGIIERMKSLWQEEHIETVWLLPPCFWLLIANETKYVNYRFKYLYYYTYNDLKIDNRKGYEKFSPVFNEILVVLSKLQKDKKLAIISSFRKNLIKFMRIYKLTTNNALVDLFTSILHQIKDTEDIETIQKVIQEESKKLEALIVKNKWK